MRLRETFIVTTGMLVAATAVALAAAGSFDTGFGVGGIVREPGSGSLAAAWTTAVEPDGRILVAGSDQNDFRVRRYLADGADDTSFGAAGIVSLFNFNGTGTAHPTVLDLAVDGYGRTLCAGVGAVAASSPRATVVRLLPDGALDASFGTGGVVHFNDALAAATGTGARTARVVSLTGVAVQPDGKVVVAGRVSLEMGKKSSPTFQYAIFLARLHPTGVLDTSFGIGGLVVHDRTPQDDLVQGGSVGIQRDGKIVVGVTRSSYTLSDLAAGKAWVVTRYLPTGAVDTAFGSVLGANRSLLGLTVDTSDRILVTGSQAFVLNANDVVVARYLPGGALDATFGSGGSCVFGPNADDRAMSMPVIMVDGRIVFSVLLRPSAAAVPHAVRLTAGGVLDAMFGSGGISDALQVGDIENTARSVAVAPDGDVVVAGRVCFDNGPAANTFEWVIARFQGN